jgi:hypothetical protein
MSDVDIITFSVLGVTIIVLAFNQIRLARLKRQVENVSKRLKRGAE